FRLIPLPPRQAQPLARQGSRLWPSPPQPDWTPRRVSSEACPSRTLNQRCDAPCGSLENVAERNSLMHGSFPELGSGESGEGGQGATPVGIRSTRRGRGVKHQHRMPFGAELVPDGVRFRLWAPKAREVAVALPDAVEATGGQPLYPMQRAEGGWFTLTTGAAKAGSRYQFAVGKLLVPDPASRRQPDDVHGPSMVIDP